MRLLTTLVATLLMVGFAGAHECSKGTSNVLRITAWSADLVDADAYRLTVDVTNTSDRSFRMIDGKLFFNDALGRSILALNIDPDLTLNSETSATLEWSRIVSLEGPRLAIINSADVRAKACIYAIVLIDGTTENF